MSGKWVIEGFDSTNKILDGSVAGGFGEPRITEILRCLASSCMTSDEILEELARPDRGGLSIHVDGPNETLMTVGNPHYVARFVQDHPCS